MPIKFFPKQADKEKTRKRAIEFQKTKGRGQRKQEEEGIEELELEDIIPGGAEMMAATPVGAGKKVVKEGSEAGITAIIRYLKRSGKPKKVSQKRKDELREQAHEAIAKEQSKETRKKKLKENEDKARVIDYREFNK